MSAVSQDISVSISERRCTYIIDPFLALSPFGLLLTRHLSTLLDTWIPRSLRHIIDNTPMYLHLPQHLPNIRSLDNVTTDKSQQQAMLSILQAWEQFQNLGYNRNKLYYFADAPQESNLPETMDNNAIWHFEALSSLLDSHLPDGNPLLSACRDTLALALTVPSSIILTQIDQIHPAPLLCQQAQRWNIPTHCVDPNDDWLQLERDIIRQQLVLVGLPKLQWFARLQQADLRLSVFHLVAPSAPLSITQACPDFSYTNAATVMDDESTGCPTDYWQDAKGFWYPL